ncbi:MAG: hypothetical protein MJK13_03035 [Pseudomonadales bacterium]|nr:hypothetical protein [Pseudomonadales bacterium]
MYLYRQLQPQDPVLNDGSDKVVFGQILDSQWLDIFVLVSSDGQLISSYYI